MTHDLRSVPFEGGPPPTRTHAPELVGRQVEQSLQTLSHLARLTTIDDDTRICHSHSLGGTSRPSGQHGGAAQRGLGEHQTETLHLVASPAIPARRREHVGRAQPRLHVAERDRTQVVHSIAQPVTRRPTTQSSLEPAAADQRQVQPGPGLPQQGDRVDESVLSLAGDQTTQTHHQFALDAQCILRRPAGRDVRQGAEVPGVDGRVQHRGRHPTTHESLRLHRGVAADCHQKRRIPHDRADRLPRHGQHGRQRDLGAEDEDEVRVAPPAQGGAEQPQRKTVTELHEFERVGLDRPEGEPQQPAIGQHDGTGGTDDPVRVSGIELRRIRVMRRDDHQIFGVEGLDDSPVVRLGATDPRGIVLGDEQRPRRPRLDIHLDEPFESSWDLPCHRSRRRAAAPVFAILFRRPSSSYTYSSSSSMMPTRSAVLRASSVWTKSW